MFGRAPGLYGPARGTAISRTFPDNDSTAIGATLAAGSVGSAVLPLVAGALVGTYSWRLLVGGLLPPFAMTGVLVWRTVPETGGGVARISSSQLARDVLEAIKIRGVVIAVIGTTVMVFAFQGLSGFFVTYLVSIKDMDQATAAVAFSLLFIGAAIAQVVAGNLADRFGDRPVLVGVTVLNVPLLVAMPFVENLIPIAALSLLIGTRMGIPSVANAYIIAVLPDSVTGTAWGTLRTALFMIGATGSTLVGTMADADLFDESFFVLAALTIVAALLFAFLPSRAATESG
jgi:predicted MFS family arabinose efflux permease